MKKSSYRSGAETGRDVFIADAFMTAGVFACALCILGFILMRSGFFSII